MTTPTDDDEFTELTDFHPDRVDLVGKAANGTRFLIAKSDTSAGLLDPEFVRGLVAKTSQEAPVPEAGETVLPNGIVIKGSAAAMAAFIHAANTRHAGETGEMAKAEMSAKGKNDLPDSAFAYIEPGGKKDESGRTVPRDLRHFPLNDEAHVRAALSDAPKSPFGDKAMPKIRAAAKKFGIDVSKEAGMPDTVAKDAGDALDAAVDDGQDGLDPTVPAAVPDDLDGIPGDPTDPGSPAWEAVDAATAVKWSTILAAGKRAVCWLKDRELLEAATVDPDDQDNACDLATVLDALDYAIGVLAPFAVSEQSESDGGALEMVGKSAGPSSLIEAVVMIAKAGRVLSSANESKLRSAHQSITDVLASLPQAPADSSSAAVTKEEATVPHTEPAPVAKDTAQTTDGAARDAGPADTSGTTGLGEPRTDPQQPLPGDVPGRTVVKSALPVVIFDHTGQLTGVTSADAIVQKADGDKQMMAVFDQAGNLIGVVDSSKVQPVSGAGKKDEAAKPDDKPAEAAPDTAPAAAAADDEDLEPQPSAAAGTPADQVTKASGDTTTQNDSAATGMQDVVKAVTEQVAKALESSEAAHQQVVSKMEADKAEQAKEIEALKARLETVENTPAMPKVALNGAVPPAQLRGQDQGHAPQQVDVAKARERKAELYSATGPDQVRIAKEMQADAVAVLEAIHAGR